MVTQEDYCTMETWQKKDRKTTLHLLSCNRCTCRALFLSFFLVCFCSMVVFLCFCSCHVHLLFTNSSLHPINFKWKFLSLISVAFLRDEAQKLNNKQVTTTLLPPKLPDSSLQSILKALLPYKFPFTWLGMQWKIFITCNWHTIICSNIVSLLLWLKYAKQKPRYEFGAIVVAHMYTVALNSKISYSICIMFVSTLYFWSYVWRKRRKKEWKTKSKCSCSVLFTLRKVQDAIFNQPDPYIHVRITTVLLNTAAVVMVPFKNLG